MTKISEKCRYTKTHNWVRVEGDIAICGINDYEQFQRGKIVFVELPEINRKVCAGDGICVLESVKSASDVYTPISGIVIAVNKTLLNNPGDVNKSCYDKGWLFKIKMNNQNEFSKLLDSKKYSEEVTQF